MKKVYLAAPGPTPLPPEVMAALALPIIHHRTKAFSAVVEEVRAGLKEVFQTSQEVLLLAATGTGGMEAAICNLTSPGDKILVVEAGKFGERFTEIGKAYGLQVVVDRYDYGQACDPKRLGALLEKEKDIKLVCVQASETSTGVHHPIQAISDLTRKSSTLLVVDGITGVGVFDLPMDAWGIDVLISGSQKAFMLPPGLAFIALSQRAWEVQKTSKHPKFYFDLQKEKTNILKNTTAYTPAINLIFGLRESLKLLRAEGLQNTFSRHAILAKATQEACKALGLKLFAATGFAAEGVTAVCSPEGVDGEEIVKQFQVRHQMTVAEGQGSMKGKIFRLAHMGYVNRFDMLTILAALEDVLFATGYQKFERGAGLIAAQRVMDQTR